MPIRILATSAAYSPEQVTILISAYEAACADLGVLSEDRTAAEAVAAKILECAARGEFDPDHLRDYAVRKLKEGGSSGRRSR